MICVAGDSGSGKTTLIRRLLSLLPVPRGRIGIVKHTHHRVRWHPPGKDSAVLWAERPGALGVAGPDQTAVFTPREGGSPGGDGPAAATRRLVRACRRLPPGLHVVVAEGFRDAEAPTIWVAGPPARDLSVPGLRAVIVPARHREGWEDVVGPRRVRLREEPGEIAGRVLEWAVPLPDLAGG